MTAERVDIRDKEIPLEERIKAFDEEHWGHVIDNTFFNTKDNTRVRYMAYLIQSGGDETGTEIAGFIMDALSVGDKVFLTIPVEHLGKANGATIVFLKRNLGNTPKRYESPTANLD